MNSYDAFMFMQYIFQTFNESSEGPYHIPHESKGRKDGERMLLLRSGSNKKGEKVDTGFLIK